MRALPAVSAAVLILLAGCLGSVDDTPAVLPDPEAPYYPQVVVAVIDTGATPYHEHFQTSGIPDHVLATFTNTADGLAPQRVSLSQEGDFDARLDADTDVWSSMEQGVLYYFEGTNVLGISFTEDDHPVLDDGSHGTATTGSVVNANPDGIVVLVEGIGTESEQWAAAQPWIDLISMSYGPTGSVPGGGAVFGLSTSAQTKVAWDAGKVPVGAADNTPSLAPNDETAGPPWVVGVAGDHPDTRCREHGSGTFPDFTADFTQDLPRAGTVDEYGTTSGTSFATPTTAGVFGDVIQRVREAWGHRGGIVNGSLAIGPDGQTLTNADVRAAFERTAYYFGAADCEPGIGTLPTNPAAPWAQMGWGHVGPEIANATVDHLLGIQEAPAKSDEAQAFQDAAMTYRETLWGVLT